MLPFDDVPYPLALGRDATVMPEFSTSVAVTASGFERRNSLWSDARLRFDVGPGIRSEAELGVLIAFFRARRGAARGFRLRDPSDFSSNGDDRRACRWPTSCSGPATALTASFPLVKRYGEGGAEQLRRITRPRPTPCWSASTASRTTAWTLDPGGVISFAAAACRRRAESAPGSCSTCRCALPRTGWRSPARSSPLAKRPACR